MNARKSKQARTMAREVTTGQPVVAYERHQNGKTIILGKCTRREYKIIKQGLKLGQ